MEILSFEGSNGPSKRKRGKNFVAIATIVALGFTGSTFAASVTLNSGNNLEFGQGVSQAAACNSSMKIIPTNRFANASGGGTFSVETITVMDTTTATAVGVGLGKCAGQTIRIAAYGPSSSEPLNLSGGTTPFCDVAIAAYSGSLVQATNPDNTKCVATVVKGQNFFSIVLTNYPLNAASVSKITLESF